MSLRFFADQCVPSSIIRALREKGHQILRLKDSIAVDSPDPVVLAKAQELQSGDIDVIFGERYMTKPGKAVPYFGSRR